MKKNNTEDSEDYSRGMMLALTDALALLATTGPQATIAAAGVPSAPAEDVFGRGRRAGWDKAALIIRAAQASTLVRTEESSLG